MSALCHWPEYGFPFPEAKGRLYNQPFLYCQHPSLICHYSLPVVFQQPPDKSPWVCFCSWGTRLVHLGKLCDYGISSSLPSSNLEQWLPIVPHTDFPFFLWLGHCPYIFPKCYVYTHNVSSKKKKKPEEAYNSVYFSLVFWVRILISNRPRLGSDLLSNPSWPWTPHPPALASQGMGLQASATPSLFSLIFTFSSLHNYICILSTM